MIPGSILIMLTCLAVLALIEPNFMKWLCARMLGWAQAFEEFKKDRRDATAYWDKKLGVQSGQLVREEREA